MGKHAPTPRPGLESCYLPPAPPLFAAGLSSAQRAVLEELCSWPEMGVLAAGVGLSVEPGLGVPFVVRDAEVAFAPGTLADLRCAAIALRHALELALWQRLAGVERPWPVALVLGLLAARVAALYASRTPRQGGGAIAEESPPWMARLLALVAATPVVAETLVAALRESGNQLLRLQGLEGNLSPEEIESQWDTVAAVFEQGVAVAAPVELLLASGGDTRLRVDPLRGLNNYGCSPKPRPWAITFASSTATSISTPAYSQVEALRQQLIRQALKRRLPGAFSAAMEEVKRDILAQFGAARGTRVVLTTSGTDAELCALFLALLASAGAVVNVVVGPGETGSNVELAAAGQHFDSEAPLGVTVRKGSSLDPFFDGRVEVEGIPLRGTDGRLRPPEEVDREVEEVVEHAVAAGKRALLHVLDVSKTGLVAPSLEVVARLQERHPAAVDVVVDACQLRVDTGVLGAYNARNFIVLLTGSKFLTGPPFAGTLLVPPPIARRVGRQTAVPAGFRAYTTPDQWPRGWRGVRQGLSSVQNLGLLFRWSAALWETRAFRAVPTRRVKQILSHFEREIRGAIEGRPHFRLVEGRAIDRGRFGSRDGWDNQPTIFTFTVSTPGDAGTGEPLPAAELKKVYEWLNRDISTRLPEDATARERQVAAKCCHIGQPVVVARPDGVEVAGLRISAGARLVSGVSFDPTLGASDAERLAQEIGDALLALEKIDLIARRYACIAASSTPPQPDGPYRAILG